MCIRDSLQAVVLAVLAPIEHLHCGVHMPLNEVAAKACADGHGTLQIDEGTGLKIAEAGDLQGLHEEIEAGGLCGGVLGGCLLYTSRCV